MVPFCQFFNHHISDVLYDFAYNEENPYKSEESRYLPSEMFKEEWQRAEVSSSEISDNSDDYDMDREYDYTDIDVRKINWCSKISDRLREKEKKAVEIAWRDANQYLKGQLWWGDWAILVIAQMLEKINILQNEYVAGRMPVDACLKEIGKVK